MSETMCRKRVASGLGYVICHIPIVGTVPALALRTRHWREKTLAFSIRVVDPFKFTDC
jgi:hypothetical protein